MSQPHFSGMPSQVPVEAYPAEMVRLACWHCARKGQYRKADLVSRFPGWGLVTMLNHLAADCPRNIKQETGKGCGAHYANLC